MSKFDWDKLASNLQQDALGDGKKTYQADERFYKLSRDENDNGGALIRFLPDPEEIPFIKMTQINAQQGKGKPFVSENSPQTIGLPDPFNERFSELWGAGKQEEAKKYGRKFSNIANIKVIKDPANPENEGKIFLFDMSPTLFEKVKNAAQPSESELALGGEAKEVYDPVSGNSFLLKVKKGSNGFLTYEDSKFAEKVDGIYKTEAEAIKDIETNAYKLSDFLQPESFLSYDELKRKLDWFDGVESQTEVPTGAAETKNETVVPEASKVVPEAESTDDELDDLLDDLLDD
jgi:hypothetical protein